MIGNPNNKKGHPMNPAKLTVVGTLLVFATLMLMYLLDQICVEPGSELQFLIH